MSKYTEQKKTIYKVDDYISNCFGGYPYTDEEQEMLDSLELAIETLEIADRLEQADTEEMAIRICCSKCRHTMCRRNPKYEGEQGLFEIGCDLFGRFKNDAILVLADIRGDNND